MKTLALSLVASLLFGSTANAENVSGNFLYEACTTENDAMVGFCIGYLVGEVEGKWLGGLLFTKRVGMDMETDDFNEFANIMFGHCVPTEASSQQLRDVAVKYLAAHPETRHESARFLVWQALVEAFPCGEAGVD